MFFEIGVHTYRKNVVEPKGLIDEAKTKKALLFNDIPAIWRVVASDMYIKRNKVLYSVNQCSRAANYNSILAPLIVYLELILAFPKRNNDLLLGLTSKAKPESKNTSGLVAKWGVMVPGHGGCGDWGRELRWLIVF